MDNGYRIRENSQPNLESVGFLGHVCRLPRQKSYEKYFKGIILVRKRGEKLEIPYLYLFVTDY